MSRSTWACELKCLRSELSALAVCHAPRERVSWNSLYSRNYLIHNRHAPRERVSWNSFQKMVKSNVEVTLHVSVWVEISSVMIVFWCVPVTLHVSVWVEMHVLCALIRCYNVTLHVSVWVEIQIKMADNTSVASRSTWACELKCCRSALHPTDIGHAPRERVSWNSPLTSAALNPLVTLHVSVWVEISSFAFCLSVAGSRSTWACELKSLTTQQACEIISHAPRERVSWNIIQNISIQYIV